MKREVLATLNAHRVARQPVALVTHLASGEGGVVTPSLRGTARAAKRDEAIQSSYQQEDESGLLRYARNDASLNEAIQTAFHTGKSGLVRVEGEEYFITIHLPPARLIVIGAVHISQYLAEMARMVSLDCTIIDPRTAFATPERFSGVNLLAQWPQDVLPGLKPDAFTAFAALTHDPKIDDPALDAALNAKCFYIGALGSRKTHTARLTRLEGLGHDESALAAIHAPIGLDIGALSPAEIAVSILAEIIAAMRMKRRAV